MKQSIIAIATIVLLASCGQSSAPKETEENASKSEETMEPKSCEYSFNADSTLVTWTAFKTTEKIGVGGPDARLVFWEVPIGCLVSFFL